MNCGFYCVHLSDIMSEKRVIPKGYVGAGGIGVTLSNALGLFRYDRASLIIITIFIVVLVIDYVASAIRKGLE